MKRYIRTRNKRIFDTQPKKVGVFKGSQFFILNEDELVERYPEEYGSNGMWCCRYLFRCVGLVEKQADTIEELICDDDLLYIYDLYPDTVLVVEGNVKPFGYQKAIKLKEWLDYNPKFDLFIRDLEGNYIKRAKTNENGELILL